MTTLHRIYIGASYRYILNLYTKTIHNNYMDIYKWLSLTSLQEKECLQYGQAFT